MRKTKESALVYHRCSQNFFVLLRRRGRKFDKNLFSRQSAQRKDTEWIYPMHSVDIATAILAKSGNANLLNAGGFPCPMFPSPRRPPSLIIKLAKMVHSIPKAQLTQSPRTQIFRVEKNLLSAEICCISTKRVCQECRGYILKVVCGLRNLGTRSAFTSTDSF